MKKDPVNPYRPWMPIKWDNAHARAIQMLEQGQATPEQQKMILEYILLEICKINDMAYFPESRDTDFSLGKQFVGQQILKLLKVNLAAFKDK